MYLDNTRSRKSQPYQSIYGGLFFCCDRNLTKILLNTYKTKYITVHTCSGWKWSPRSPRSTTKQRLNLIINNFSLINISTPSVMMPSVREMRDCLRTAGQSVGLHVGLVPVLDYSGRFLEVTTNTTQYNATQHNSTQHNTTQHNTAQHKKTTHHNQKTQK